MENNLECEIFVKFRISNFCELSDLNIFKEDNDISDRESFEMLVMSEIDDNGLFSIVDQEYEILDIKMIYS